MVGKLLEYPISPFGNFPTFPTNLGRTWNFQSQFHERTLGGPVADVDAGPSGVLATGTQDPSLKYSATQNDPGILNQNVKGLLWWSDNQGNWHQSTTDPPAEDYPGEIIDLVIPSSNMLAITSTGEGFIAGGWGFFGFQTDNVDGLLFTAKPGSTPRDTVFNLIQPEDVGLKTDMDDWVSALCSGNTAIGNDQELTTVMFGVNATVEGANIAAAVTRDGGESWEIAEGRDGVFEEFTDQAISACSAVPREVCQNPKSVFQNRGPCSSANLNGGDFFLAVGETSTEGDFDARAFWSDDGLRWEVLDLPSALTGPGNQFLEEVIAAPEGIILIGNDNSSGIDMGQLWVEDGTLVLLQTDLEDSRVDFFFVSGAINPDGYVVLVGYEESRLSRIWYSRSPIFN